MMRPADFGGHEVNRVLDLVRSIEPTRGNVQLSLLATSLCVACRSCGVDEETLMGTMRLLWRQAESTQLIPRGRPN
jgi:hypothetical protein